MIGVIEKVIVDCLYEAGGEDLRRSVFTEAAIPIDRVYRMDQHYDDTETASLITATLKITGISPQELYDLFSRVFFDVVEDVFPEFLRMSATSEDLVRKQAKIHALIAAGSRKPGQARNRRTSFSCWTAASTTSSCATNPTCSYAVFMKRSSVMPPRAMATRLKLPGTNAPITGPMPAP